ncbi:hypothetical protein E2562_014374 [Oryza meyeriana var. granulata]|uniref:Uncharacterized protein n=1 Tax=Oryza meyeriana var. granulata TaxID=110450 RepID=A0A6G1C700_9ORYZ|nr:hypothetical protein E2562_014374 [Oryza meyeriana var. granulata]
MEFKQLAHVESMKCQLLGWLPIEIAAYQNRWKDVEIQLPDDPMHKIRLADLKSEETRAYKRKDYLTANKLYNMAASHDPENATLYSNKIICWLKMGEGMNALQDAQLCRMLRPDWPKACYREGAAYMFLKSSPPSSAQHQIQSRRRGVVSLEPAFSFFPSGAAFSSLAGLPVDLGGFEIIEDVSCCLNCLSGHLQEQQ